MVGRELTKVHQEFLRGTATARCRQLDDAAGEFTVVVGPVDHRQNSGRVADVDEQIAD